MEQSLFWSHETTLKSEPSSARAARAFVRHHLEDHSQPAMVDDLQVVVSELVALLISHHVHPLFTVSLRSGGGEVLLVLNHGASDGVGDLSRGSDGTELALLATQALSEAWGIDRSYDIGEVVWASFAVDSPEPR